MNISLWLLVPTCSFYPSLSDLRSPVKETCIARRLVADRPQNARGSDLKSTFAKPEDYIEHCIKVVQENLVETFAAEAPGPRQPDGYTHATLL